MFQHNKAISKKYLSKIHQEKEKNVVDNQNQKIGVKHQVSTMYCIKKYQQFDDDVIVSILFQLNKVN